MDMRAVQGLLNSSTMAWGGCPGRGRHHSVQTPQLTVSVRPLSEQSSRPYNRLKQVRGLMGANRRGKLRPFLPRPLTWPGACGPGPIETAVEAWTRTTCRSDGRHHTSAFARQAGPPGPSRPVWHLRNRRWQVRGRSARLAWLLGTGRTGSMHSAEKPVEDASHRPLTRPRDLENHASSPMTR